MINYTCIEFHTVNHFLPIFFLQTKPVLCTVVSAEMIIHSLSLSFKHPYIWLCPCLWFILSTSHLLAWDSITAGTSQVEDQYCSQIQVLHLYLFIYFFISLFLYLFIYLFILLLLFFFFLAPGEFHLVALVFVLCCSSMQWLHEANKEEDRCLFFLSFFLFFAISITARFC